VEIVADPFTSVEHVLSRMETKADRTFSETVLDEDVRRLYDAGYICTDVERRTEGDGIHLTLHISTNAVITQVMFDGNRRMSDRLLKEKVKLYEGGLAQPHKIRKEEVRIEELYREKGYHFVCVGSNLNVAGEKALLTFRIYEGPRVKVSKVIFEENDSLTSRELIKIVRTRRNWLLSPSPYIYTKIDNDADLAARHYRNKGWLDAKVQVKTEFKKNNTEARVTFVISEGERYTVGKIKVIGNKLYSTEEIMKAMSLAEGDPLDLIALTKDVRNVRDMYTANGYMLTKVFTKERPREGSAVLDIDYVIEESIKTTIERVDITGNDRTRDEVIRRELRFFPGDVFNSQKIRDSKNGLARLGFFSAVDIGYTKGSTDEQAGLTVSVQERDTGQLMFGASYNSDEQFGGFVRLTENNFDIRRWPKSKRDFIEKRAFKGDGQQLSLQYQGSSQRAEYTIDFTEPYIFNRPISLGLGAYANEYMYSQYDMSKAGWHVTLGRKLGYDTRISLRYKRELVDLDEIDTDVLPVIGDEYGENSLNRLRLSVSIDKRNRRFFPTMGFQLGVSHEWVGDSLGGDLDFEKASLHCSWIRKLFEWPVGTPHVLRLIGDVKWANETNDTSNVPIYERFFAGGIRTVRGYENRSLGPTINGEEIGGNFRLILTVEYSFPLYEEVIHGVLFWDNGEVWVDEDDFDWGDLRRSVGVGLRFQTPVFPVEFYYGWALDELPGERSGRFHFALGRPF